MRKILLSLVMILVIAVSPALASAATPAASAPSVLLFHENSVDLIYGTANIYTDSAGVIHTDAALSSFVLPMAPIDPFGTTIIDVHALTIALAKANVETSLDVPANAATVGFEAITLRAALGSRWFVWRVGDSFVLTDKGKIPLSGSQVATPAGDPGYAMSAAFPLREVVTLLGGKVIWNPKGGGIVQVEFPTTTSATPPFYVS